MTRGGILLLAAVAAIACGIYGYVTRTAQLEGAPGSYTPRDPLIEMNGG